MRAPLLLCLMLLAACERPADATGQALSATGELVALSGAGGGARNACFTCHGLRGEGDGVSAPRLAGLEIGYLQKQLQDYAVSTRADKVMTPIAKGLDDRTRRSVAAYYAALPAPDFATATTTPAAYLRGGASCATCHGALGEGRGDGSPAIAGQPAAYTLDQLQRWSRAERRNDPRGVMRTASAALSSVERAAIAAWLERRPTAPSRDSAAPGASAGAGAAE